MIEIQLLYLWICSFLQTVSCIGVNVTRLAYVTCHPAVTKWPEQTQATSFTNQPPAEHEVLRCSYMRGIHRVISSRLPALFVFSKRCWKWQKSAFRCHKSGWGSSALTIKAAPSAPPIWTSNLISSYISQLLHALSYYCSVLCTMPDAWSEAKVNSSCSIQFQCWWQQQKWGQSGLRQTSTCSFSSVTFYCSRTFNYPPRWHVSPADCHYP